MKRRGVLRSRPGPTGLGLGVLTMLVVVASACGGDAPTGTISVQIEFVAPDAGGPVRGVLSGIVDTIRLTVTKGGKQVAQGDCAYEGLGCALAGVDAGSGYSLTADALAGQDLVYSGTAANLTVKNRQNTPVTMILEPAYDQDRYPPAPVADLSALAEGQDVVLSWTASGDDGLIGRASGYLIFWADQPIDETNLASASQVDGDRPREQGQSEELRILALPAGSLYYFALKVVDELGNESALSNLASAQVD